MPASRAGENQIRRTLVPALHRKLVQDELRHRHRSRHAALRRAHAVIHAKLHGVLVNRQSVCSDNGR